MNALRCVVSVGFLLVLASCKPKSGGGGSPAARGELASQRAALDWSLRTSVGDYEKHGRKNAKWDRFVREALTEYAKAVAGIPDDQETRFDVIGHYSQSAVEAGCDDPLVRYIYCRYVIGARGEEPAELAEAYRVAAEGMQASQYSAVRKFYAVLRAAGAIYGRGLDTNAWPQVAHFRKAAGTYLYDMLSEKSAPITEVYETCHTLLQEFRWHDGSLEFAYESMDKPLFENWPDSAVPYLLKGEYYLHYAWCARGGGYANTITEESWEKFRQRLAEAEKALDKAWAMDPKDSRIPTLMIYLELGQGQGRGRMESWFTRAMTLNTNNYEACGNKLFYLYPQWYGSAEDMLAFGRQCVRSDKWGGHVPLILADAHEQVSRYLRDPQAKKSYWKQPEVWADIKASFEKFFKLYPGAIGWRYNYARAAYTCEQWKDLNEQLKLLEPVNDAYFGGHEEFEKMVRLAKEHTEPDPAK